MDGIFEEQLEKAKVFHGEICGGVLTGTKMAIYAIEEFNLNFNEKNPELISIVEIDRCVYDAVQAITQGSTGTKSVKLIDYGKFAITFYNKETGKAIRLTDVDASSSNDTGETIDERIERYKNTPAQELFKIENVNVYFDENNLPGMPTIKKRCSVCNEVVLDNKHSLINGKPICQSCFKGSYYEII
ncbi:hypothetical protein SDC9_29521 [bioreactor metagenome]|uniref:Formylmethanofuran dehydrogenase subunit E domain-containing protein n=1 Tax=bioreactor metagenome TaxID=1076179 RepID=A0A644UWI9_9ZZZZ|nr:FmdE family protein [Methanobrevibacter sp.]MEA4957909.1 FmdE family protein [Methanobrevibacter sp.]